MATKLRLVFTITIVFLSFYGHSQQAYWKMESARTNLEKEFSDRFDVKKGAVFTFEEALFKNELRAISATRKGSKIVYFPDGDGELKAFNVSEASIMSPELAAKFPTSNRMWAKGWKMED